MRSKTTKCFLYIAFLGVTLLQSRCTSPDRTAHSNFIDSVLRDRQSFFYIDAENYPVCDASLPIGMFDSGTGGLTVLDAVLNFDQYDNSNHEFLTDGDGLRDFQEEYFVYLGDQANMPYGNYAAENNTVLLEEHILKDVQFLLGNRYYQDAKAPSFQGDKMPVKAIVIACNTATAYGTKIINDFLAEAKLDMKVIGVIGAGVRGALQALEKDKDASIAIMATAGTVSSGGYVTTLREQISALKYTGDISIFQQAGIGVAGAIDGSSENIDTKATAPRPDYKGPSPTDNSAPIDLGILSYYGFDWSENHMLYQGTPAAPSDLQINSVENYIAYHLVSLLEQLHNTAGAAPLKVIILGCTHYPFYTEVFEKQLERLYNLQDGGEYVYRPFMADKIELIDPALNTARELYEFLQSQELYAGAAITQSEFYISIPNLLNPNIVTDDAGNFTYEYKYGRNAGELQEYVRCVPFSRTSISADTIQRLSAKMPLVFDLIRQFNRENPKLRYLQDSEKM